MEMDMDFGLGFCWGEVKDNLVLYCLQGVWQRQEVFQLEHFLALSIQAGKRLKFFPGSLLYIDDKSCRNNQTQR
jgi:hypothetical protein